MEALKFMIPPNSAHTKLITSTFPSPLEAVASAYRLESPALMDADHSSNSSPHPDYDCWSSSVSRRSSPTTTKSDREYGSRSEDDSEDEVSVGCESPPPHRWSPTTPPSPASPLKSPLMEASRKALRLGDGHQSAFLKFSIDNILRPEFGGYSRKPATATAKTRKRPAGAATKATGDEAPVDLSKLSKDCASGKEQQEQQVKTESADSKQDGNILWPAWVYCTRYSDRPSSGKSIVFIKYVKWCCEGGGNDWFDFSPIWGVWLYARMPN